MWQQLTVAVLVFACGLWLLWNVILPSRLKQAIAGRDAAPTSGCGGCAMAAKGCPSAAPARQANQADSGTSPVGFDRRRRG